MNARALVLAVVVFGFVATGAVAAELTIGDLIRAHEAGVSADVLVQLVSVADVLPEIGPADEIRMFDADLPEEVVTAVKLRRLELERTEAVSTGPTEPDDKRLVDVVRLVTAGVSEKVIVGQAQRNEQGYDLTTNDLIYLKESGVPRPVIAALLENRSPASAREPVPATRPKPRPVEVAAVADEPEPAAVVRTLISFGPLLRVTKKVAVIRTSSQGRVIIGDGRIEYRDDSKQKKDVTFFDRALKKVWLECERNPNGDVCFEIRLKTAHGDTYRFRDVDWKAGGNAQIHSLFDTLKDLYPRVKYKIKAN